MWQGLEGRAERVAEQKRSFCGAMKAEAATLKSLVLAGELSEPDKSHPEYKNPAFNFLESQLHFVQGRVNPFFCLYRIIVVDKKKCSYRRAVVRSVVLGFAKIENRALCDFL